MNRIQSFNTDQLAQIEASLDTLDQADDSIPAPTIEVPRDWPHAPLHRIQANGTYIVTTGTLHKHHHFRGPQRLDLLETSLLQLAKQHHWQLEAWAVFSNHYHFVGHASEDASQLNLFISQLHSLTAMEINRLDNDPKRKVWHNFWETQLTYEKSYFARLNYVHQNPVKHGLVTRASDYRWCSAGWFERTASQTQIKTIYSFKTNQLNVLDDFEVVC